MCMWTVHDKKENKTFEDGNRRKVRQVGLYERVKEGRKYKEIKKNVNGARDMSRWQKTR